MIITCLLAWNVWTRFLFSMLTLGIMGGSFSDMPSDPVRGVMFEPDLELLQPRRAEDRDLDVTGTPYVAHFERDGRDLLFVAARHEQDIERDPTHELVRRAIDWLDPDVVIVEGVPTSAGENPRRFLEQARRRVDSGMAPESMYAAILAVDNGSIVIGGEPDPSATTDAIRDAGFSDEDLLAFLLARRSVQMVRRGNLAEDEFDRQAKRALDMLKRKFKIQSEFDVRDFRTWFKRHLGESFEAGLRQIKSEVGPMLVDDPSPLRQMSILAMKAREHNLATLQADMLQEHERVLVVYGSGHLRWERRMLEDMMGPPVLVSENPGVVRSPADIEIMRSIWATRIAEPPQYFMNEGYDEAVMEMIRSGIDVTRSYLGNYGPVQVFVLGNTGKGLDDQASLEVIAEAYCDVHFGNSRHSMEGCIQYKGLELARKARDGAQEAYLSYAMEARPPIAELVFINTHDWGDDVLPTRGIHEYTHVYQKAFEFTPTWMMEGSAELLACHLGEKHGWGTRRAFMEHCAHRIEHADGLIYTIREMEDVETVSPAVKRWYRELAYDSGAWAVVYMITCSDSQSIRDFFIGFYPEVNQDGWERAVLQYTGHSDLDAFYSGFEVFMSLPLEERLNILDSIRD